MKILLTYIILILTITSCCIGAKEEHLGNNIYLSEYDIVDRRILYQECDCATSGIEIVPMTVSQYSFNSDWIIAKTEQEDYYIIKNKYETKPTPNEIKSETTGPIDYESFEEFKRLKSINLKLKTID